MPTDLPPDYKPAPPKDGDGLGSANPGVVPSPGGSGTPGDIGEDVVGGPADGVPRPGPATGPDVPGHPGGDVVIPGMPGSMPVF